MNTYMIDFLIKTTRMMSLDNKNNKLIVEFIIIIQFILINSNNN